MSAIGKCLCGSVKIRVEALGHSVGACHCSMCRRWGGGPFFAIDCGAGVAIEGQEHVTVFDSSQWADRGFCSRCGSHLFYRLKASQEYMLPVGLLDDRDGLQFEHQVFIDEKPDYYSFANETKNLTGQQLFEMYAPKT